MSTFRKAARKACLGLAVLLLAPVAQSAIVQKFTLDEMVQRSDMVFRGVLRSAEPGFVQVGGGELPTMAYTFDISDMVKNRSGASKTPDQVTITMLGNVKSNRRVGDYLHVSSLPELPSFAVGSEYVLFTTAPSAGGLSSPVGLAQGAFSISSNQGVDMAVNGLDNQGLFNGPVSYDQLKAAIAAAIQ